MLEDGNHSATQLQKHIIVGSGITGLALARAFDLNGDQFSLLERSDQVTRNGLGFIIGENGFHALKKLRLADEFLDVAFPVEEFTLMNEKGNILRNAKMEKSWGLSRCNFIQLFLNVLPKEDIHFDHHVVSAISANNISSLVLENGSIIETSKCIFAADGARSKIRESLFEDVETQPGRFREIVGFAHSPDLCKKLIGKVLKTQYSGGGLSFGALRCEQDRVVWYFQYDSDTYSFDSKVPEDMVQFIRECCKGWHPLIEEVLESAEQNTIHHWYTMDMKPMAHIHANNLLLIGDAAHPLLPFTSQGVGAALDDALGVVDVLMQNPQEDYTQIFTRYYAKRKEELIRYFDFGREACEEALLPESERSLKIPVAK